MSPGTPGPGLPPRTRPMILFGLLTLMTFGGPLAIVVVGRGGEQPTWPPDRPIEWWVFWGVTVAYVALLATCITDAAVGLRRARRARARSEAEARPDDEHDRPAGGPGRTP